MRTRFMRKVSVSDGCWNWTAMTDDDGYGRFKVSGRSILAHRLAYELFIGPIPAGLTVDHLCRNRRCVRPEHLEAVPKAVNTLRGMSVPAQNARKSVCEHGHPLDAENTYIRPNGARTCRTCNRISVARYRRKELAA